MNNLLSTAGLHEIRYRTESTNLDALSGFAKLVAHDRADLLAHSDAYQAQVRQVLTGLLYKEAVIEQLDTDDKLRARIRNQEIRAAAQKLGINDL